MSSATKNPKARLRDNQRRSRARRKEYLQELEDKYHNCKILGAEASSELQAAARKVLEENKQLRQLLHVKGVSDDEVSIFLENRVEFVREANAVSELDTLLSGRKLCVPDELARPLPETLPRLNDVESPALANTLQTLNAEPALLSYTETVIPRPMYSKATHEVTSIPTSFAGEISGGMFQGPSEDIPSPFGEVGIENTSSCDLAATIIASLRSDGLSIHEVKSDLGCPPMSNCQIDNSTLFEIMDRYTGHEMGMSVG